MSEQILSTITNQQELENLLKKTRTVKEKWAVLLQVTERRDQKQIEWLVGVIDNTKNSKSLRKLVAQALCYNPNGLSGETFVYVIENRHEDWQFRKIALQALFYSKYPKSALGELLSPIVADKTDHWEVRYKAIQLLGDADCNESLGLLASLLLDSNEYDEIRENAAYALGILSEDGAYEVLISVLNDPSDNVRIWVINALGHLGDERAIPYIREIMRTDPTDAVRRTAVHALSDLNTTKEVDIFAEALKDKNWAVRWNAIWGLNQVNSEEAISIIATALNDRSKEVREWAAMSLERHQARR
jgi:hypothetical protein